MQSSSRITPSDALQSGDIAAEHDDAHDDTLTEVVMAVDMTPRGTVGCCYYVAREERLYFMEDIQVGDVDIVDTCGSTSSIQQAAGTMLTGNSEDLHRSYSHSSFD